MIWIIRALAVLAAGQFLVGLATHAAALSGQVIGRGIHQLIASGALALVWVAAIFVSNQLSRDVPRDQLWSATFRKAPRWLRLSVSALGAYPLVVSILTAALGSLRSARGEAVALSAWYLGFAYTAAAILYCGAVTPLGRRRCSSGHPVSPVARYCDQCGERVEEPAERAA